MTKDMGAVEWAESMGMRTAQVVLEAKEMGLDVPEVVRAYARDFVDVVFKKRLDRHA